MLIGSIKKCNNCGVESYFKANIEICPGCGENINTRKPNKAPETIVFLGTNELNRRAVVEMRKHNMIDEF